MSPKGDRVTLRFATIDDCGLILDFIRELALYEKAPDAVVATADQLREHGFGDNPQFEALIAKLDGEPVGMALFHTRFSTWLGQPTLYLEDIFVREAARGHGVGRRLMARLATIALERGWGRIDFHVLDWNPARGFYRKLGFDHLEEWLRYGAAKGWLERLAEWDIQD
ncbi:MAG TPA: GNAT family N-acetyltransferase [Stellaceae bacterium]|nr:GNAT family N-acetyltransferase [Stellaceae bacterium]